MIADALHLLISALIQQIIQLNYLRKLPMKPLRFFGMQSNVPGNKAYGAKLLPMLDQNGLDDSFRSSSITTCGSCLLVNQHNLLPEPNDVTDFKQHALCSFYPIKKHEFHLSHHRELQRHLVIRLPTFSETMR